MNQPKQKHTPPGSARILADRIVFGQLPQERACAKDTIAQEFGATTFART